MREKNTLFWEKRERETKGGFLEEIFKEILRKS